MTHALEGLTVLDLATFVAAPFCCTLLGEFGADSTDAVDDLLALLSDENEDPQLRGTAATALGELGSVAMPALAEMLRLMHDVDSPGNTRALCALAAAKISPQSVPELLLQLQQTR